MANPQDTARVIEGGRNRFLPPLATALAFLLVAALFCVFALMDLSRMENLLLSVLQNRASSSIKSIEKASQDKYRRLLRGGEEARFPAAGGFFGADEDFSLREVLARSLLDLARYLDLQDQEKGISAADLEKIAAAENLQGIVILNADGQVTGQTGERPPNLETWAAPLLAGREEVSLHLFDPTGPSASAPFIGLRRQDGKGVVFLALGVRGLQFWEWRTAVQETLREFLWSEGLAYFILETPQKQTLAEGGTIPEEPLKQFQPLSPTQPIPGVSAGQGTVAGEMRILELAAPFQLEGKTVGTARVGLQTRETDAPISKNRRHIFIWTGVMMTIGLAAMALLVYIQNRHLSRLQAMQERLHQAERLSSLGKLGAGVAHEIRNPLNAISIAVQRLKREFFPADEDRQGEFQHLTQVLREEIGRLNAIVEDFLSLSRSGRLDIQPQPVETLFQKTLFLVHEEARTRGIHLQAQGADSCPPVPMDLPKMQQVLLNLVKNAIESISGEGGITLAAEPAGRDYIRITVADTGKGISPEEQQRIFDPHYTTKEKGVGLGLAIAHEIIHAHGGNIRVRSEPGQGTTFEIFLPRT
ncbi:MAG: two-component system sensor histidine kinase NtrB [Desulfobaccales bacterium]